MSNDSRTTPNVPLRSFHIVDHVGPALSTIGAMYCKSWEGHLQRAASVADNRNSQCIVCENRRRPFRVFSQRSTFFLSEALVRRQSMRFLRALDSNAYVPTEGCSGARSLQLICALTRAP